MTVSYTGDVANASSFGCFWTILRRWKGSVYKLVWKELFVYLTIYFGINSLYRFVMDENQREVFEKAKLFCNKQIESIPMSFVLGFYVSLVIKRWWDQYWVLPLPDSLALYISASLNGQDERGRILRRTIMRYALLSFIIMLQRVSIRVKKRFPTLQHLVDAGMMMESEMKVFVKLDAKSSVSKFWLPCVWASNLVMRAREENRIKSDHMVQTIVTELSEFRRKLGLIVIYDHLSVPLVYSQVVTLAVHTYFIISLIGKQWINPAAGHHDHAVEMDLYFPIFLTLQFVFYLGWLKVAETLINPFGEDDDDYELNWLIDRHIQVSYMVVDEIHEEHPELLRDQFWDQVVPSQLPYNVASNQYRRNEPEGSTAFVKIKSSESDYGVLQTPKTRRRNSHISIPDTEIYSALPKPQKVHNWFQHQFSARRFNNKNRSDDQKMDSNDIPSMASYNQFVERRASKDQITEDRNISKSPRNSLHHVNGVDQGSRHLHYVRVNSPQPRPRAPTPTLKVPENNHEITQTNTNQENLRNSSHLQAQAQAQSASPYIMTDDGSNRSRNSSQNLEINDEQEQQIPNREIKRSEKLYATINEVRSMMMQPRRPTTARLGEIDSSSVLGGSTNIFNDVFTRSTNSTGTDTSENNSANKVEIFV